jgi:hypothetical protein
MKNHRLAASATLAFTIGLVRTIAVPINTLAACDSATAAVQYLAANQKADGSLDMSSSGGFGNPGASVDFAIGAAAVAVDPGTIHRPGGAGIFDYLAAQAPSAATDAGLTAKLLLGLAAGNVPAGKFDYHNFGGEDLLGKLTSPSPSGFFHPTGPTAGTYGDGSTFTEALAIMAQVAIGIAPPQAALTWLKGLENAGPSKDAQNTGFPFKGWSTAAASNAAQGDTNSTAIALEALTSAGDATRNPAALAWLRTQQNSDGGFPFLTPSAFGTASDADSDALVIQALIATGQDVATWAVSGNTPRTNLLSFQDPATGGLSAPTPDTFTTSQVPAALAGKALPLAARAVAGAALPAAGCPPPLAAGTLAAQTGPAPRLPSTGHAPRGGTPALLVLALLSATYVVGAGAAHATRRAQ